MKLRFTEDNRIEFTPESLDEYKRICYWQHHGKTDYLIIHDAVEAEMENWKPSDEAIGRLLRWCTDTDPKDHQQ